MTELIKVDPNRFIDALVELGAGSNVKHSSFEELIRLAAIERGLRASDLLTGLGRETVKKWKSNKSEPGLRKPRSVELVRILLGYTAIDVSLDRSFSFFHSLDFNIGLNLDSIPSNDDLDGFVINELVDFWFQIEEANCVAISVDGGDIELDLRLGFDRLRLLIEGEDLEVDGNWLCAMPPLDPSETDKKDYKGWFKMQLAHRDPLSWILSAAHEGKVVSGQIAAEKLGRVKHNSKSGVSVSLTSARDALKVRIIQADGSADSAPKTMADEHRNKMIAAVARKAISDNLHEYEIFNRVLGIER